jgi:hypothetical protein
MRQCSQYFYAEIYTRVQNTHNTPHVTPHLLTHDHTHHTTINLSFICIVTSWFTSYGDVHLVIMAVNGSPTRNTYFGVILSFQVESTLVRHIRAV